VIILGPNTRPGQRHYRPEAPAPRTQVSYRCSGNHDFAVVLSAEAEPPEIWACRCGASAHRAGTSIAVAAESANMVTADSERDRRMALLRQRRSPAEGERLLAERLAELAAMREAGYR